jgi:hypothetical protein
MNPIVINTADMDALAEVLLKFHGDTVMFMSYNRAVIPLEAFGNSSPKNKSLLCLAVCGCGSTEV